MPPIQQTIGLYRNAYAGLASATWWLSLVLLINRSGTMVIPFMTVYLTRHLHFSIAQAGLVMACFGSGAIVGALLGGWLSDRISFYQVQFWSLFSNGLLFILLGRMHTFPQICAGVFAMSSVGDAFRPANSIAIAAYSLPENRTRSYALNSFWISRSKDHNRGQRGLVYHLLFTGKYRFAYIRCLRGTAPRLPALVAHHRGRMRIIRCRLLLAAARR